jgi:hypothetical protein
MKIGDEIGGKSGIFLSWGKKYKISMAMMEHLTLYTSN